MIDQIGIFTIITSLLGILLFIISLYFCWKILELFPKEAKIKRYWYLASALLIIFIFGYLTAIVSVIMENTDIQALKVPIVYLFGGIFVLVMITVSYKTYSTIIK